MMTEIISHFSKADETVQGVADSLREEIGNLFSLEQHNVFKLVPRFYTIFAIICSKGNNFRELKEFLYFPKEQTLNGFFRK